MTSTDVHKASCLCGAVKIEVTGDLPAPSACHCRKCRKHTGNYEAGTDVPRDRVKTEGSENINWYQSSEKVRRGFCKICGSSLFFDPLDQVKHNWIGIMMGAFDGLTNTKLERHIFVADKGDYYDLADGLPQNQQ